MGILALATTTGVVGGAVGAAGASAAFELSREFRNTNATREAALARRKASMMVFLFDPLFTVIVLSTHSIGTARQRHGEIATRCRVTAGRRAGKRGSRTLRRPF